MNKSRSVKNSYEKKNTKAANTVHGPTQKRRLFIVKKAARLFIKKGYALTTMRDIAKATGIPEDTVRALFKRIARYGEAWPVAHDHYFTATAVADLAHRVAGLNAHDGCARAAPLRDQIGGGRKVAIHILEFFDRIGYTRRVRDTHILRGSP